MKWDEWRGSGRNNPTMWIKRVLQFSGCRMDIHKMQTADDIECFHTHPAYALRLILWGGYTEELENKSVKTWYPGMFGIISPTYSHRIDRLRNGHVSYSLWLRFRVCAKVQLRGNGWNFK